MPTRRHQARQDQKISREEHSREEENQAKIFDIAPGFALQLLSNTACEISHLLFFLARFFSEAAILGFLFCLASLKTEATGEATWCCSASLASTTAHAAEG